MYIKTLQSEKQPLKLKALFQNVSANGKTLF